MKSSREVCSRCGRQFGGFLGPKPLECPRCEKLFCKDCCPKSGLIFKRPACPECDIEIDKARSRDKEESVYSIVESKRVVPEKPTSVEDLADHGEIMNIPAKKVACLKFALHDNGLLWGRFSIRAGDVNFELTDGKEVYDRAEYVKQHEFTFRAPLTGIYELRFQNWHNAASEKELFLKYRTDGKLVSRQ